MEQFISMIAWVPTIVSFLLAFGLGWFWYSDKAFGRKWRTGKGGEVWQAPMWMPMLAQAGSTFLLAVMINLMLAMGQVMYAVLVGIIVAGFIKANGFYGGKTMYAVSVETGYVVVMTVLMIAVQLFLM